MRQGIVGGLLVFGGVIFSPFGAQFLDWLKALVRTVFSGMLSFWSYTWTIWMNGGYSKFIIAFLAVFWVVLLFWAITSMFVALRLAIKSFKIAALDTVRYGRMDFWAIPRRLFFSILFLLFCILFLYIAGLVDIVVGGWVAKPAFFTKNTYNSLFMLSLRWYLYVYSVLMFATGLFLIKDSCKRWTQNILHG